MKKNPFFKFGQRIAETVDICSLTVCRIMHPQDSIRNSCALVCILAPQIIHVLSSQILCVLFQTIPIYLVDRNTVWHIPVRRYIAFHVCLYLNAWTHVFGAHTRARRIHWICLSQGQTTRTLTAYILHQRSKRARVLRYKFFIF